MQQRQEAPIQQLLAGFNLHLNPQGPQRPAAQQGQANFYHVLLRGDDAAIGRQLARPMPQTLDIGPAVRMMIRKNPESARPGGKLEQRPAKCLGIPDSAKAGYGAAYFKDFQASRRVLAIDQFGWLTGARLAKQAAREKVAVAPRVGGVDQHDIQVPMQPAVLKAVIQHQHLAVQLLDRDGGESRSIRSLQVRHIGQIFLKDQGLVVPAPLAGVAPAQNRHAHLALPIQPRHVLHAGRFSGSAQRQVANAHDWNRRPMGSSPAVFVKQVARAHRPAVGQTRQPKPGTLNLRPKAAPPAGHQGTIALNRGANGSTSAAGLGSYSPAKDFLSRREWGAVRGEG